MKQNFSDNQTLELVNQDQLRFSVELESIKLDNSSPKNIIITNNNKKKISILEKICNNLLFLLMIGIYYIAVGYIAYYILFSIVFFYIKKPSLVLLSSECIYPLSLCFFLEVLSFTVLILIFVSIYYYCKR